MDSVLPGDVYLSKISALSIQRTALRKKSNIIAWSRFLAVALSVALFFYLRSFGFWHIVITEILLAAVFLRLVILSSRNNEVLANINLLIQINQQEIQIAAHQYLTLPGGAEYLPPSHDYAHDLDIFGRASIYQYINRTTSEQGHRTLANWLLHPADKSDITSRQDAAKELSVLTDWRQQLQAFGLVSNLSVTTQQRVQRWLQAENLFSKAHWKLLRYGLPAIILGALLLHMVDILPAQWFYLLVILFMGISGYTSKLVSPVYQQLNDIVKEVSVLSNSIEWIEQQPFKSPFLLHLQQQYRKQSSKASQKVKALKTILDRMDYRLNPVVFLPLNTFLFWDLQQALALEKWKDANKGDVMNWFDTLGNMETISTLGTITFNHPGWAFPGIDDNRGTFDASELGHPLLPLNKRVTSSFTTSGTSRLALITGSNMAGKSTFLRSVGVNIVFAMMGAPVCASSLKLSCMRVISSMRVTDNLEESTSTFYAELKKLKYIIESVYSNESIFLLLDEILRGTNSLDRHTGSTALIRQLIKHKSVGMLATHDLELAELVNEHPSNIHNYHFDVQVEGDELFFDYKLKHGICQSLNASILMRKIGIEL